MNSEKTVMATETVSVWDENMGIWRKVFAGQGVPPDLIGAYRKATSEADQATDVSQGEQGEDLDALNRDQLNERAIELGIEEPRKLPNKNAVVEAIQAAQATDES
jgi:hypothetical protein